MKVYFQDFHNIFIKNKIKKVLNNALLESPINYQGFSVNLALVSEIEIQELNKKNRNIDKVTDVLSFPFLELKKGENFDSKELTKEIDPENGLISLGDIVICKEVAKEQAKNLGHSMKRELCFLALHGFLHLLGYDHLEEPDELEMNFFAETILNKNKVKRR